MLTYIEDAVLHFSAKGSHGEKKQRVLTKLRAFFERFFGSWGPRVRELIQLVGDGIKEFCTARRAQLAGGLTTSTHRGPCGPIHCSER